MNTILTLLTLILLVKAKQLTQEEIYEIGLTCMKEVGVDRTVIEQALATPHDLPKDIKYREFLSCSYKKQGYQNEQGEILMENIKSFLTRFYAPSDLKTLDYCKNINETTHGEAAYRTLKCVLNKLKDLDPIQEE